MVREVFVSTYKIARRIVIAVVGFTVLLIGIAMMVLPGPALVVIPAGLAILSVEFVWARRWLRIVKQRAGDALAYARGDKPDPDRQQENTGAKSGQDEHR